MSTVLKERNLTAVIVLGAVSIISAIAAPLIYGALPESYHGPRTNLGYGLGFGALGFAVLSALYSIRRAYMKYNWGQLETWLRIHTYAALLALLCALLHSDWRFQPGAASAALLLLFLTNISGVIGWVIYMYLPPFIKQPDNEVLDSPEEIYFMLEKLQHSIDRNEKKLAKLTEGEEEILEEIRAAEVELRRFRDELKYSLRREGWVGMWLYIHIPLSMAFIVMAFVHAFVTYYLL